MFDAQGHLQLPLETFHEQLLEERYPWLINGLFLRCTPFIFESLQTFHTFLQSLADSFRIHPNNFAVRGSSLLGYSMRPDQLGKPLTITSDLDLAIIDTDYYHVLDRELRYMESRPIPDQQTQDSYIKRSRRREYRKFYCYRYFDLPAMSLVNEQNSILQAYNQALPDGPRVINAFVFRDWLSLYSRWEFELKKLNQQLNTTI